MCSGRREAEVQVEATDSRRDSGRTCPHPACSAAIHCGRIRREPARLAISARDRSDALTAAAFGNRSTTSGSITTTFELSWSRRTYFPRTSVPKSERLYSERDSPGAGLLGFFI